MTENHDARTALFGARLRELRAAAGLSREELAERSGMKVGGVRNLEQGVRIPGWDSVLSLAKALGVECTAFTVEPASTEPHKPGRPKKAEVEEVPEPEPTKKKPRRRQAGEEATG